MSTFCNNPYKDRITKVLIYCVSMTCPKLGKVRVQNYESQDTSKDQIYLSGCITVNLESNNFLKFYLIKEID